MAYDYGLKKKKSKKKSDGGMEYKGKAGTYAFPKPEKAPKPRKQGKY